MSEFEYVLALDLGTSRIVAATARLAPSEEITVSTCALGQAAGGIAALAAVSDDGALLFGTAAEDVARLSPECVFRGFTDAVGDDVPLVVRDRAATAADLTARLVEHVRADVARAEGRAPASVVILHPAAWTTHRTHALSVALSGRNITDVEFVTAAEAAALTHDDRVPFDAGDTIAVFDLGGRSFEASVLRKTSRGGFIPLVAPLVLDDQSGSAFDDAVFAHALSAARAEGEVSLDGPGSLPALARMRASGTAAKHALSTNGEATITVPLDGGEATVRITRSEFEAMIEPTLAGALGTLERAIARSGLTTDSVTAILLTGGSSRIPLIAQMLSERFDRPLLAVDEAVVHAARRGTLALAARTPREQDPSVALQDLGVTAAASRRPRILGMPRRTAVALSAVAAALVVTAGATATAFATGLTPAPEPESAATEGSRTATGSTGFGLAALLTVPLGGDDDVEVSTVEPVIIPDEALPPAADPDADVPAARRAAREPLVDTGRSVPSVHPPATNPSRTLPSGSTPLAPTPTPQPVTPPTVVQPAVDDPPTAEQPPDDPAPAQEPPVDEPPADEPPADHPAPPPAEPTSSGEGL